MVNRFNVVPIKIPAVFFIDIAKFILQFIQKVKKFKIILERKNKLEGCILYVYYFPLVPDCSKQGNVVLF